MREFEKIHLAEYENQRFPRNTIPAIIACRAKVAELVDALDLGSCGATRESSSLSFRTITNGF